MNPSPIVGKCALVLALFLGLHAADIACANQVTYQVDMTIQIDSGNFDPAADGVLVAGNFNSWAMVSLTNVAGTALYVGTFTNPLAVNDWENHKFIIDHAGGSEEWESTPNRFFQVTAEDQVLPVVFFSDQVSLPVTTQVTWLVDMSVQIALGEFEPPYDDVYVAGGMNDWDPYSATLAPSVADANVYTGTFDVENTVGAVVEYKFMMLNIDGEVWERDNLGPGGARNRQFTFTNEVTELPVVYFNDETVSALVTQQVVFTVSFAAQVARGDELPTSVSVAGEMSGWGLIPLTPVPTDSSSWTGTLEIIGNQGGVVAYKFVYTGTSGEVWEDDGVGGSAGPRQLAITGEDVELPLAYFNDADDLGEVTLRSAPGGQVTLEWTAGPRIRLQAGPSVSGGYEDVPDTEGNGSTTIDLGTGDTYFRLTGP